MPQSLVVKIPTPDGTGTSAPTVFNATAGFPVVPKMNAIFLFVTEDGTIAGWNPFVDRNNAVLLVKRPGKAIYKGSAIAQTSNGPY